jgi:hypothetical protein
MNVSFARLDSRLTAARRLSEGHTTPALVSGWRPWRRRGYHGLRVGRSALTAPAAASPDSESRGETPPPRQSSRREGELTLLVTVVAAVEAVVVEVEV